MQKTENRELWNFWNDGAHPPQTNMDIDALLLAESANLAGMPLVRFYDWDRPAASIGYVQKEDAVKKPEKYTIAKRPTGGGVVYHDIDFTYTVVVPREHWINDLDRVDSYRVFHKAVVRTLEKFGLKCLLADKAASKSVNRALMQCFITPTKYDVLCVNRTDSGKPVKVAGSAQRRTKNGILHQGSITLAPVNNDLSRLKKELKQAFIDEFDLSFKNYIPSDGIKKMIESGAV